MYRVSRLLSRHPKPPSPANSRIMHAIKCGWARQTYAFAKSNDKVEKKSGVRLPKKERRVMVESFIKTYQNLNNGTFPSLHVTHKEVGGSYYIVREIVRDIIQENKVLAPPKVLQEEHKMFNSLSGDYPLGSISVEPQVSSASLPNSVHELDHGASTGEVILESGKLADRSEDDNIYIGQNAPDGKLGEWFHEEPEATESLFRGYHDSEKSKLEETIEQTEPYVGMIGEVSKAAVVETFPWKTSVKLSESLNTSSEDATYLNSATLESIADQADMDPIIVNLVDQKAGTRKIGKTTNENRLHKTSENSLGTFDYTGADVKGSDGQKGIISHETTGVLEQVQEFAASEPAVIASNATTGENLNGTRGDSIMKSDETKAKYEAFQSKADDSILKSSEQEAKCEAFQSSTGHHRDSKPTMDRMNLESWEGASRNPARPGGSPFSAFVKACVTAFSKLWSK